MIDHDVLPGPLNRCQVCGSSNLREIMDLGHQPLCDALLSKEQLLQPEMTYPLQLNQCEECSLAQLSYVIAGTEVYPATYPYRACLSWPVVEAHKKMAADLVERFGPGLAVDIGCNDGGLLAQFHAQGCRVRGVEPTDIATYAPFVAQVVQSFFTSKVARDIKAQSGAAHLITLTNVFAHMADLGEVMRGITELLDLKGVLVIENHYLLDILEGNQFDSIYHEHVRTYTLKSLMRLFQQYGMEVFDVERVTRYGGNIRVFVGWEEVRRVMPRVGALLEEEQRSYIASNWKQFANRVNFAREQFHAFLARESVVAGCSAPGRASTLLNYFGARRDDIMWTGEVHGSLKIGQYLPGCHIPVIPNKRLIEEQPPAVILLAWHYAKEIAARLRREGVTSKLYVPLPHFQEFKE